MMLDEETRAALRRSVQPKRESGTCMGVTRGWPPIYCTRTGTVNRSGKMFCRQHDPGDPEENRKQRLEKWAREEARLEAECSHLRLLHASGVESLTDQDLEQIVAAGGIRAFLPWWPGETDAHVED